MILSMSPSVPQYVCTVDDHSRENEPPNPTDIKWRQLILYFHTWLQWKCYIFWNETVEYIKLLLVHITKVYILECSELPYEKLIVYLK